MQKKWLLVLLLFTIGLGSCSHYRVPFFNKHKNYAEKMFKKVDANEDGIITRAEFDAKMDKKFTKMDIDGNGELTLEEMKEFKKSWKKHHKN